MGTPSRGAGDAGGRDPAGERTGVFFAVRDDVDLVRTAERLGYESAWTAEGQGLSAFGKLERWAAATEDIGLATGVVSVFSRTPAALAQSVATLDAHSEGRAILGLGVAHPGVVEGFHGVPFDRPLARLAEYVRLVRRYLAGDPSGFDGEFYAPQRTAFWEAFEPARASVPVYNAALGPDNVELTGELADGWLPNLYPRSRFEDSLAALEAGANRAGRDVAEVDVAAYVLASVADDEERARRAAARHVAGYLRDVPGFYDRVAREAGFGDDVAAVREAPTTAAAAGALSDAFVDALAVVGTPEQARAGLADLREAGVDLPIVRVPRGASDDAVEAVLHALAPG